MLELLWKDFKLKSCIAIIMLMLIARDIVGISVPDIVVTVIYAISMIVLKYEKMVYLIFFIFPIMCGVPGYIITIAYILLLVKGPRMKRKQLMPLLIVIFLEGINESFNNVSGLYTGILSFLSFTAVFFYFLDENKNLYSVRKCLIMYGIGTSFVFVVIYTNMFMQYGFEAVLSGMLRSGALGIVDNDITKMKGHLALNANTIAYMSISVVSIYSIMLIKQAKQKKLSILLILICLIAGIFSFSRTYLGVVALLSLLLFTTLHGRKRIKFVIFLGALCVILVYFWGDIIFSIIASFEGRMEEDSFATAGGRTELFSFYNDAWLKNIFYILFGAGAVSYWDTLHAPNAIHCGLQQLWICLGIIGFSCYTIRTVVYIRNEKTSNQFIMHIPFIVTLIMNQSLQLINPYPLILIMIPTLLFYKYKILES